MRKSPVAFHDGIVTRYSARGSNGASTLRPPETLTARPSPPIQPGGMAPSARSKKSSHHAIWVEASPQIRRGSGRAASDGGVAAGDVAGGGAAAQPIVKIAPTRSARVRRAGVFIVIVLPSRI